MPRVDDYKAAVDLALKELAKADPKKLAIQSGGEYLDGGKGAVVLPFLGRQVAFRFDGMKLEFQEVTGGSEPSLQEQVLVLHYLMGARGKKPTGAMITYREIPSGEFYYPAFKKRAIDSFVRAFGNKESAFEKAAQAMGGIRQGDLSGVAYRFLAFPHVPIMLQLHPADDEFPAEGTVLFDETISQCFSLEDVAWLAGMVVYRLIGVVQKMASSTGT
jgi:hypothetical protein